MSITVTVAESTSEQMAVVINTEISSANLTDLVAVRTAAAASAATASAAATTATNKATEVATSVATAVASASNATTKATEAAASATAAADSATTATAKADIATTKAGEASTSATNAANSASTASTKATEAAASAATATTKAGEASTSATTATTKAGEAAASATTATNKAAEVTTSVTSAANSAVTAGQYSDAAAASATAAAGSATTASTKAGEASASATAAAGSATTAQNYADEMADALVYRGLWDASGAVFPTPHSPETWDYYRISVAGTMTGTQGSITVAIGDYLHRNVTTALWVKEAATSAVLSVAGKTGNVTLASSDVGLGNVQNIDQTNASNLTSGTVPNARLDAGLAAIGNLTTSANKLPYFTGVDTAALTTLTSFARTILDDADAASVRVTIDANNASNLTSGTVADERLPDTITSSITGNAATATKLAATKNINGVAFDGSADITIADATKQPLDSTLTALANLTTAADKLPYFTGVDTVALTAFPTFARSLVGVSTKEAAKILLGASGSGNYIGIPGKQGFGVGICPELLPGFLPLTGTYDVTSDDYGNYQYSDGSIVVWIPAFYARIGHPSNPTYATYGVNSVHTVPISAFADKTAANAAGYFLPRCFIDGSTIKAGFFIDKYMCSNNGGIASSIKNGNPLSSAADHNPFSGLTGAPSNTYAGAWQAAKTRGANFFVASRFIYAALALLSLAHGQAATSTTNCAWYDATGVNNFPKGCNNNALNDTNDTTVTYTSDEYINCGKTGSGVPFAKTTHNGQACGVADLNGLMWEISQGVTCIATSKTITAATKANPVKLTITAHGMTTGKELMVTDIGGMTQLNDKIYKVTVVDANTVTLNGVNGTAFTAYTSGGSATYGTFYVAKESAVMANFTSGNTLATDHFGAVGVAANMDVFTPAFATTYASNGFEQKLGNSANQVLSPDLSGNNAVLRSLGIPIAAGMSTSGSNLFGQDYLYQYIRNELCLLSGANWVNGSSAGVWASDWYHARSYSYNDVGFRSAAYV